jgi:hypothetical protein
MEEPEDVDMSTSTTLLAQNHDRQDDAMEDGDEEVTPQSVEEGDRISSGNHHAAGEHEILGDAMDTTPDSSPQPEPLTELQPPQPPQPNSPHPHTILDTTPIPAATDGASGDSSSQATSPPANIPNNADGDQIEVEESQPSSEPASDTMPPPQHGDPHDDSPSESSDDDILQWQAVIEDTSVPDADELKEIEASKEHSATDGKL